MKSYTFKNNNFNSLKIIIKIMVNIDQTFSNNKLIKHFFKYALPLILNIRKFSKKNWSYL